MRDVKTLTESCKVKPNEIVYPNSALASFMQRRRQMSKTLRMIEDSMALKEQFFPSKKTPEDTRD